MQRKYLKEMLALSVFAILADPKQVRARVTTHEDDDYEKPKIIPAGCKEYTFHGITVIAISEKSARKKIAKKLNRNTRSH